MKKTLNFILLFISFQFYFSQFYIVNDKDGYVNVRDSDNINSKVIAKLKNGEIVHSYEYFEENKGNWINVDFRFTKNNFENGFIYKDRLINIYQYEKIPIINKSNYVTLKNKNIEIIITEKKFQKKNHKFTFHKQYKNVIEKIDNQDYYGTDGYYPQVEYSNIQITINGKTIYLPKEALKNLFEPNSYSTSAHYDEANDILYIDSLNSDGAGSYEVLWIIEKGKYSKRIIFSGC